MEGLGDRGIDVHEHVLLDQQALIPLINLFADPIGEGGLQQRMADVRDPLLGQLRDLLLVGQVVADDAVRGHEVGDLLDGEALVLRNGDPSHVLALDGLLRTGHQVLEEVDGDLF